MDRETLLHTANGGALRSSADDAFPPDRRAGRLYDDLVSDRWGVAVRLEQERIDWAWVASRLPTA